METPNITMQNIDKIGELFLNCITEAVGDDGKLKKAINFEILKQMLSDEVIAEKIHEPVQYVLDVLKDDGPMMACQPTAIYHTDKTE